MDATIKGFNLNEQNLKHILEEIISINLNDNVNFEILIIKDIREEAEYSGYRVTLNGTYDKVFKKFNYN